MSSFDIERPLFLLPSELDEICQLVFDAFEDHAVLPHELDEWSTRGIAADLGGLFINTAARGGLFLARRPANHDGSKGALVGLLSAGQPKKSLPPKAEPPADGGYITTPPESLPETPEIKRRREWRNKVHEPNGNRLFEKAFGKPSAPAVHITFIAVSPKAQRLGIGKALMKKAEDLGETHEVGVTLMTDTLPNMQWYTWLGYSENSTDEWEVAGQMVRFWAMSKGVLKDA